MNYKLIHNQEEFQSFIDFLPELKENESYFLILVARKKWFPESGIPSAVKLKREAVNSKERIKQTIKQFEIEIGAYTSGDLPIHQNNLGIYMAYNPKNQYKASFDLINKLLDNIKNDRKGINCKGLANDVVQSSNGSKNFIDIDVDIKENENYLDIIEYIKSVVDKEHLTIVKTNGGFHCLIRLENLKDSKWYQKLQKHPFKSELNIMSNDLIPIPGCNQGIFVPYVIKEF